MAYESINVAEDKTGLQHLVSLGARGVPIVCSGKTFVYAQDLNEVARFVGLDYHVEPELTAKVLITRLINVIDLAGAALQQIPERRLHDKLPGRDRTYQALANHIFEIASGYQQVAEGAEFDGSIATAVPVKERNPAQLIDHGRSIESKLQAWWLNCTDRTCARQVATFYGPQSLHAVLERCTWHATQHVRQIMMILEMLDVVPERPLTRDDLKGLPLPDGVWDG